MAHKCEPNHNRKWWGRVEHRKPWIRGCPDTVCTWCLGNRVHSTMKRYLWRMDEYEERPEQLTNLRATVHKFSGWPNSKRPFRYW